MRLVLLRPRNADNLGAVARAMKNFGVTDWVLVRPEVTDLQAARKLAVHATELLEHVRIVQTIDEAIADCVWVVGTSSRHVRGKRRLSPRECATQIVERRAAGPVALVFGDERSGMSNEDVDRCHDLSSIVATDEQPSLNLAQAALLYCYEVSEAERALAPPRPAPRAPVATDDELIGLEDALRRTLQRGRFLGEDERHALRELMTPLRRSTLTKREVRLWRAAAEALGKRLGS